MSGHAFRIECCSSVFGCMKISIIINLESIEMLFFGHPLDPLQAEVDRHPFSRK